MGYDVDTNPMYYRTILRNKPNHVVHYHGINASWRHSTKAKAGCQEVGESDVYYNRFLDHSSMRTGVGPSPGLFRLLAWTLRDINMGGCLLFLPFPHLPHVQAGP